MNKTAVLERESLIAWLRGAIGFVIAGSFALIAWEIILSNFIFRSPPFYDHPVLGTIRSKGKVVWSDEGYGKFNVNSLGLRAVEPGAKPPGIERALVLGDSHVEAFHVSDVLTSCSQAEGILARHHYPVQVINGGRSGACPADYLAEAAFFVQAYHPDKVVVVLNERDFTSDLKDLSRPYSLVPTIDGYQIISKIKKKSGFIQTIPRLLPYSTVMLTSEKIRDLSKSVLPVADDANFDHRLTRWVIDHLQEAYPKLSVLYLPELVFPGSTQSPDLVENVLADECKRRSIPYASLRSALVSHFERTGQPPNGFENSQPGIGHLNSTGHRIAAGFLASLLERR